MDSRKRPTNLDQDIAIQPDAIRNARKLAPVELYCSDAESSLDSNLDRVHDFRRRCRGSAIVADSIPRFSRAAVDRTVAKEGNHVTMNDQVVKFFSQHLNRH